jgi:hypothetical protein
VTPFPVSCATCIGALFGPTQIRRRHNVALVVEATPSSADGKSPTFGHVAAADVHPGSGAAEPGACKILPGWQTRSRGEHPVLDGGADAVPDLLGQRHLRRSIEFELHQPSHAP